MKNEMLGVFAMHLGAAMVKVMQNGDDTDMNKLMEASDLTEQEMLMVTGALAVIGNARRLNALNDQQVGMIFLTLKVRDCLEFE